MAGRFPIPGAHVDLIGRDGRITRPWLLYLSGLEGRDLTPIDAAALAEIRRRLDALEAKPPTSLIGYGSVLVDGIGVQLEADEDAPLPGYYYGTSVDGAKGYHALPDPPPETVHLITEGGDFRITADGSLRIL